MPETSAENLRPSVSAEFAELVAAMLNAQAWSQAFTAKRTWCPVYDLEQLLDTLVVCVVPTTLALARADRNAKYHNATCEIGFMRKPDWQEAADGQAHATREAMLDAAADAQCGLVEEVCDYFANPGGREFTGVPTRNLKFNIDLPEVPTLVLREHLEELGQVTSVIRLTGRVRR